VISFPNISLHATPTLLVAILRPSNLFLFCCINREEAIMEDYIKSMCYSVLNWTLNLKNSSRRKGRTCNLGLRKTLQGS